MNDRTYDYYLIKGNEVIDLGPEAHFAFMQLKLGDLKKNLDENYPGYHLKVQTPFEYEDVAQIKVNGRKFEEQFLNNIYKTCSNTDEVLKVLSRVMVLSQNNDKGQNSNAILDCIASLENIVDKNKEK